MKISPACCRVRKKAGRPGKRRVDGENSAKPAESGWRTLLHGLRLSLGENLSEQIAVFLDQLLALCRVEPEINRAEHQYPDCLSGRHDRFLPWFGLSLVYHISINHFSLNQKVKIL